MTMQKLFVTFLGTGNLGRYADAVSSLLALCIGTAIVYTAGMQTLFMLTFVLSIIAVFESGKFIANGGESATVAIDKATGIWFAMMISLSVAPTLHLPYAQPLALLLTYLSFLGFEAKKPSTIGWMDRELKGGLGIVLADIIAGIASGVFAALILTLLAKFF